jgi:hypothetical protein
VVSASGLNNAITVFRTPAVVVVLRYGKFLPSRHRHGLLFIGSLLVGDISTSNGDLASVLASPLVLVFLLIGVEFRLLNSCYGLVVENNEVNFPKKEIKNFPYFLCSKINALKSKNILPLF